MDAAVAAGRRWFAGRRTLRLGAGVILLGLGLVGLLMPIMPGWLLIFVGLAVLGVRLPFMESIKRRALARRKGTPKA